MQEINESSLLDMAKEKAVEVHKKDCTLAFIKEESKLIKAALDMIDIANVFIGPYSNTAMIKIEECLEVLDKNFEQIPEVQIQKIRKNMESIRKILNDKIEYGKEVDVFLKERQSNILEMAKDKFLDADLVEYEKIMNKMSQFKKKITRAANGLCNTVDKIK